MGHLRRIKKDMFKNNRIPTQKPVYGIVDGAMAIVKKVSILKDYKLYTVATRAVSTNAMQNLAAALNAEHAGMKKKTTIVGALGKLVDFCKKMFGLPDSGQSQFLEKLEKEHRRR